VEISKQVVAALAVSALTACRTNAPPPPAGRDASATTASARSIDAPGSAKPPPSASVPASERVPAPPAFRIAKLPEGPFPSGLSPALTPEPPAKTGDGCKTPRTFEAHGVLDEEPVRAKVEVLKTRVTLTVSPSKPGKTRRFRATLDESLCAFGPTRLLEATGRVDGTKPGAAQRLTLLEVSACSPDGARLRLDIGDDATTSLALLDTRPDRIVLQRAYQAPLGTAQDVVAAVARPNGAVIIAYLTLDRDLRLAELAGSPLALTHSTATDLGCKESECEASLDGYEREDGTVVLLPKLAERGCTIRFSERRSAELWTFGPGGFGRGNALAGSEEFSPGPDYPGGSSETRLYWVGVEGKPGVHVLAKNTFNDDPPSFALFLYDSAKNAFTSGGAPIVPLSDASDPPELSAEFARY